MSLAAALKRVLVAIGGAVVLIGATLALVAMLLPVETVRRAVEAELSTRLGLPVTVRGPVSIGVTPQLVVRMGDLVVGPTEAPVLVARGAVGALRLLPLIAGTVSISEYGLDAPRMTVRIGADGATNLDRTIEAMRGFVRSGHGMSLPDLRINDGALTLVDERTGRSTVFGADVLSLSWPHTERAATASGTIDWHGEAFEFTTVIARPLSVVGGDRSSLRLRLSGKILRAGFDGQFSVGSGGQASGTLTVETSSLRQALRWLGQPVGPGAGLGPFAVKGDASVSSARVMFNRANVELDGNLAEGTLTAEWDTGRTRIQGTLDAGRINASGYLADLPLFGASLPGTGNAPAWSQAPLNLAAITAADLDLRLSARELVLAHVTLGRTGAAVSTRANRVAMTIGESLAFGGTLRGSLSIAQPPEGPMDVRLSGSLQRAQLTQGFGDLLGLRRLEGTGNAQLMLEARGNSIDQIVRTMTGEATLTAIEGAVVGVNAEAMLRRLERRPLAAAGADARAGRTPFERLLVSVRLQNGVATAEDAVMDGPVVHVALTGSAQIPGRELDLRGVATLKRQSSGSPNAPGFELPFIVQGDWNDPFVLPDPEALIRRSGAAAPLRDLTRDRDALRAVTDAISRAVGAELQPDMERALPTLPLIMPPPVPPPSR